MLLVAVLPQDPLALFWVAWLCRGPAIVSVTALLFVGCTETPAKLRTQPFVQTDCACGTDQKPHSKLPLTGDGISYWLVVPAAVLAAVFQAERDSERFALYARKAALDERAEEIRQQLKVRACVNSWSCGWIKPGKCSYWAQWLQSSSTCLPHACVCVCLCPSDASDYRVPATAVAPCRVHCWRNSSRKPSRACWCCRS
jgi:hypothetical protein